MEKDTLTTSHISHSEELSNLLAFIKTNLSKELPILNIDVNYFILGALSQKENNLYARLDSLLISGVLDALYTSFYQSIASRALSAVKKNRILLFDKMMEEIMSSAEKEALDMGSETITTEHVFLAILNNNDEKNKARIVFNKAGITYKLIKEKMRSASENDDSDDDNSKIVLKKTTIKAIPKSKVPTSNVGMVKIINLGDMDENEAKDIISSVVSGRFDSENITMGLDLASDAKFERTGKETLLPAKAKRRAEFVKAYCTNLNDLAKKGKIEPLIGRDKETNEIIRILGRKKKNNAILVGGEGVGKTAIAENLAFKITKGDVPGFLRNKKLVSLDMTALIAGTTLRGMFEERVKGIIDDIKADSSYILFMDNIGAILADKKNGDYDFSSMISRSLDTGEIQVIGTSDFASYRKTFDADPSLARRFQKIIVDAPSVEDSISILNGLKTSYEEFHKVKYSDDAVSTCVYMADRYISERNLPDSAIDLMDEVGAFIGTSKEPAEIKKLREELKDLDTAIEAMKEKEDYEAIDELKKQIKTKTQEYNKTIREEKDERQDNPPIITKDDILNIVSVKTNIPVSNLSSDDKKKLSNMNDRLKSEVIGQNEAIDTICKALKRNRIGLRKNGCMYSALTIGKTGCGKTLIAKKLAKELFGNENALIRFDMSEYSDKVAVNKLIGSNPGYVGYEEGGQLTEAVKNKKHCVLLLDEIEKADPEIYNIFLQVLDEGFLTDNSGMRVDFKNVIVIFTSNIGAKAANDFGKGIGFKEDEGSNTKRILLKELKKKFPPEFLNRLDDVIYFNSLTNEDLRQIIHLEIKKFEKNLNELGYSIEYEENVVDYILNIIQEDKEYGARPIMRAIQDTIEAEITDALLLKDYNKGYKFKITCPEPNQISVV